MVVRSELSSKRYIDIPAETKRMFTIELTPEALAKIEKEGIGPVFGFSKGGLVNILQRRQAKRDGGRIGLAEGSAREQRIEEREEKDALRKVTEGHIKKLFSGETLTDADYDWWIKKLGDVDKDAMTARAEEWAEKTHGLYPKVDKEALTNSYLHAISSYEVSTDNPEGGEGDKGFQKLWRSKARQLGMQVKETRQKVESLFGEERNITNFFEAQRDILNNKVGFNAYSKYGEDKDKAYEYIDNTFTTQLDEMLNAEDTSSSLMGKPVINPREELEPDLWKRDEKGFLLNEYEPIIN